MTLIQQLNANYQSTCSAPSPFFFHQDVHSIRHKENEEQRRQKEEMRLQSENVQAVIFFFLIQKHFSLFFDPVFLSSCSLHVIMFLCN